MSTGSSGIPTLTVNRSFIQEFIKARQPRCALGLVEVQNRQCAFIALCPGSAIPSHIPSKGFRFSHTLIGTSDIKAIQIGFEFYGLQAFNVLLNPNNPIVQKVLQTMIVSEDCFFFTLDQSSGNVTAFHSEIGRSTLINLTNHWQRIQQSTTTDEPGSDGFCREVFW
ncbi:MAG: hypothetical protein WCA07_09520 [Gloeobacterales cyanobacterium]